MESVAAFNWSDFDLASFGIEFPSPPLFPDPLLSTPPQTSITAYSTSPSLSFDHFDRSRIQFDLRNLPADKKGELPSPHELSVILQQYFKYLDPFAPFIHLPSFSIKSCSTLQLVCLLALGDVYSPKRTFQWAQEAYRYMLKEECERHEADEIPLPLHIIQVLMMSLLTNVFQFPGKPSKMLLGMHHRITLAHACRQLRQIDREEREDHSEETEWLAWVQREARRRTLVAAYLIDTSVALQLRVAWVLRISELDVPIPESEDLWHAETQEKWKELHSLIPRENPLYFNQVITDLVYADGTLVSGCNGVMELRAIALGIQEIVSITRRLWNLSDHSQSYSRVQLMKCKDGLEAWKATWQARSQGATRAQYIAIVGSWCHAQLLLHVPEVLMEMACRVLVSDNLQALSKSFLKEIRDTYDDVSGETLNELNSAASAVLLFLEIIAGFQSSGDNSLTTLNETFYPGATTSLFLGGLCLWYCQHLRKEIGGRTDTQILARLGAATDAICGMMTRNKEQGVLDLIADLLLQTSVWRNLITCPLQADRRILPSAWPVPSALAEIRIVVASRRLVLYEHQKPQI